MVEEYKFTMAEVNEILTDYLGSQGKFRKVKSLQAEWDWNGGNPVIIIRERRKWWRIRANETLDR